MARKTRKPEYSRQLRELKLLGRTPCVYALTDLSGLIFYVGQSFHIARRFMQHHWLASSKSRNPALAAKIAELGDDVRIILLEKNPKDLSEAERRHIAANPQALNMIGPNHWAWQIRDDKPWAVGTGIACPSTVALRCCDPTTSTEIRAMMGKMTMRNRCAFELETMDDLPHFDRERLGRWLALAAPKMSKVFGAEIVIIYKEKQPVAQ